MTPTFDTDTSALKQREALNASGTLYRLETWIKDQLTLKPEMRILDLGCGTGKMTFALAEQISADGFILGLDISQNAVDEVNRIAKEQHLSYVTAVQGNLDDCVSMLNDYRFDLIVSAYAIYYAQGSQQPIGAISINKLKQGV